MLRHLTSLYRIVLWKMKQHKKIFFIHFLLYTYKPIVKYSCEIYPIYIYMYMYMFYNKKYGKIRFTDWYFFSMTIWRFICCNKYYIKINNRFTVKKGRNLTEPEDEFTDDDNIIQSLDVVDHGWVLFLDKQIVYIMFIIYHCPPLIICLDQFYPATTVHVTKKQYMINLGVFCWLWKISFPFLIDELIEVPYSYIYT